MMKNGLLILIGFMVVGAVVFMAVSKVKTIEKSNVLNQRELDLQNWERGILNNHSWKTAVVFNASKHGRTFEEELRLEAENVYSKKGAAKHTF